MHPSAVQPPSRQATNRRTAGGTARAAVESRNWTSTDQADDPYAAGAQHGFERIRTDPGAIRNLASGLPTLRMLGGVHEQGHRRPRHGALVVAVTIEGVFSHRHQRVGITLTS